MDIKEFVSDTLKQIIDGVVDAQEYAKNKEAVVDHITTTKRTLVLTLQLLLTKASKKRARPE